jgi:ERCC4-type nuclease
MAIQNRYNTNAHYAVMEGLVFKIDQREGKLKGILVDRIETLGLGVSLVLDNLVCGDFVIEYGGEVVVAFERKTWKDLLASIKDSRYRSQKDKMLGCIGKDKIMYILEGATDWTGNGSGLYLDVDKKSVISSVINTQLRDGIRLVSTKGIDDTCEYLIQVLMRIVKEPSKYMKVVGVVEGGANDSGVATKEDYIVKHKINSAEDLFFFQMTQVPGISAKTATAFVKEFGTMKSFYERLVGINENEKLSLLKEVIIEENGKKRRINSKVAESVVKYML